MHSKDKAIIYDVLMLYFKEITNFGVGVGEFQKTSDLEGVVLHELHLTVSP